MIRTIFAVIAVSAAAVAHAYDAEANAPLGMPSTVQAEDQRALELVAPTNLPNGMVPFVQDGYSI